MEHFYPKLRLPISAKPRDVVKAAAKAMHPMLRRQRDLRLTRRRLYRDMLNAHDTAQERARRLAP